MNALKYIYLIFFFYALSLTSCTKEDPHFSTIKFNNDWKFSLNTDDKAIEANFNDENWRVLNLPHDWGVEGSYAEENGNWEAGYLPFGVGYYRKTIDYDKAWKNKNVFIDFDGVYTNSTVYINGHKLGFYPNGYLGFSYELTPYLKKGKNTIVVKVDHEKGNSGRWYTGNGIYRNVWLRTENQVYIPKKGVRFQDTEVTDKKAKITVTVDVTGKIKASKNYTVQTVVADSNNKIVFTDTKKLTSSSKKGAKVVIDGEIENPNLWSPKSPNIYHLTVKLKKGTLLLDEEKTIVGVRDLKFSADKGFILNGVETKIKGVCEHHTAGAVGAAVPNDVLYRRLKLLKNMGANAIRTAHNPFSPEFYTMCDTLGIMVLDELFDGWNVKKAPNDYGLYFKDWWKHDVESFIKRDRNHPSIIMWSIGNEVRKPSREVQKEIITKVKEYDSTRPITQGGRDPTRGMKGSQLPTQLDIKGFNGDGEEKNVFEEFHKEHPNTPMIGTEIPHTYQTRGVYRTQTHWRRRNFPAPWELGGNGKMGGLMKKVFPIKDLAPKEVFPEEKSTQYYQNGHYYPIKNDKPWAGDLYYQSSYDNASVRSSLRKAWQRTRDFDYVMGQFRWTGFDYLGETNYWPSRMANFGVIDIAGFPKDSYYLLQSLWTSKPMVHILPHWNHEGKEGVKIPVVVYTNCDEVTLFLNGKSLGKQTYKDEQLVWQVPYKKGVIKAVAYKNGKAVAETEIKTAEKPAKIKVTTDKKTVRANGEDVIHFEIDITDENGVFVPYAENLITVNLKGKAKIIGTDNGDPIDVSDYKTNQRKAFRGKALFIIQTSKEDSGTIEATFSSKGLESTTATIEVVNNDKN
ncbi:glycoside hydrolase family 2 TIM barrel-domain containing protein [Tenacibaculum sp. UWU-22]|uniref:glycoside hydrolase family 2 TIM barrel-domain containing protein n=1 Tax=Tenacibaculum sp. UWU-22 TaxID=3234187 RepID=UPI0034DAEDF6